jgi:hypothetical protein
MNQEVYVAFSGPAPKNKKFFILYMIRREMIGRTFKQALISRNPYRRRTTVFGL